MSYSNRFFINPSNKKVFDIYKVVSEELRKDMSHIETSYSEILSNELNSQLLKEKEKYKVLLTTSSPTLLIYS